MVGIIQYFQSELSTRFMNFHQKSNEIRTFFYRFTVDINYEPDQLQMELLELLNYETLKNTSTLGNIQEFCRCLPKDFEKLISFAEKIDCLIVAFGSTFICEQAISAMSFRKNKFSSRLTIDHLHSSIRICSSGF